MENTKNITITKSMNLLKDEVVLGIALYDNLQTIMAHIKVKEADIYVDWANDDRRNDILSNITGNTVILDARQMDCAFSSLGDSTSRIKAFIPELIEEGYNLSEEGSILGIRLYNAYQTTMAHIKTRLTNFYVDWGIDDQRNVFLSGINKDTLIYDERNAYSNCDSQ